MSRDLKNKSTRPDLSAAETEVMDALWEMEAATARDMHGALNSVRPLAYTTVATLLSRLREKGYVSVEERGNAYLFRPLVEREHVARRKLDNIVDKLFRGSLEPLAVYIAENRNLSEEQLEVLAAMVRDHREPEAEADE